MSSRPVLGFRRGQNHLVDQDGLTIPTPLRLCRPKTPSNSSRVASGRSNNVKCHDRATSSTEATVASAIPVGRLDVSELWSRGGQMGA
jgi:hypothetical protein